MQLHFNFISVKGTVTSSQSAKFYASLWDSLVHVSVTRQYNVGLADRIVSNGGSLYNKVHSLTTFNDNSFALSDTGDSYIKAYKPTAKQCSVVVGNGKVQEMEVKPSFPSQ